jgi:hypothetical protein
MTGRDLWGLTAAFSLFNLTSPSLVIRIAFSFGIHPSVEIGGYSILVFAIMEKFK